MSISVKEASVLLGLKDDSALHQPKYKRFFLDKVDGNRMFDFEACKKRLELEERILEMTKLFVEYVYHIEEVKYADMSKVLDVSIQALSQHSFGHKLATKMLINAKLYKPYWLSRFDEYYNFKHNNEASSHRLKLIRDNIL